MRTKLRPCLGGIVKHSWEFVRNVNVTTYNSRGEVTGFSLKGRYRCRNGCGAHKTGQFDMNAPMPGDEDKETTT